MKTVIISDFKARCTAIIDEVNRSKDSVVITRRGKPVAVLEPYGREEAKRRLGNIGRMKLNGDIVHADFPDDWEVNR